MQGSTDKNELEASPSLIADLKSPVMIILYRLIYSLLTHRDFDSYSVNTLSYPLSSIVNYQEHAQGQTWAPSVILILLISENQNLSPHTCALQGRSSQLPPGWSFCMSVDMVLWGLYSSKEETVERMSSWTVRPWPHYSISRTLVAYCSAVVSVRQLQTDLQIKQDSQIPDSLQPASPPSRVLRPLFTCKHQNRTCSKWSDSTLLVLISSLMHSA